LTASQESPKKLPLEAIGGLNFKRRTRRPMAAVACRDGLRALPPLSCPTTPINDISKLTMQAAAAAAWRHNSSHPM